MSNQPQHVSPSSRSEQGKGELLFRARPDGAIMFANHSFTQFFADSSEELAGRNVFSLLSKHDRSHVEALLNDMSAAAPAFNVTCRIPDRDGIQHSLDLMIFGVYDSQGNVLELHGASGSFATHEDNKKSLSPPPSEFSLTLEQVSEQLALELLEQRRAKNKAHAHSRSFESLAERLPEAIIRCDHAHVIRYVNHAALKLADIPIKSFIGSTLGEKSFLQCPARDWKHGCDESRALGEEREYLFKTTGASPSTLYKVRFIPEFSATGEFEATLLIIRDRTQDTTAQTILKDRTKALRSRILELETLYDLLNVDSPQMSAPTMLELAASTLPRILQEHEGGFACIFWNGAKYCSPGAPAHLEHDEELSPTVFSTPIPSNEEPDGIIMLGYAPRTQSSPPALTEREKEFAALAAEQLAGFIDRASKHDALKISHKILELGLQSAHDPVFILSADSPPVFINCNLAVERVFGYKKFEILGKTNSILHVSNERLEMFHMILDREMKEKNSVFLTDFTLKRKNGEIFYSEHFVSELIDDENERLGWIYVVRDISQYKDMEFELQKTRDELEKGIEERTQELQRLNEQLRAENLERRQTEKMLEQSERFLRGIIQDQTELLYRMQPSGLITYVNTSFVRFFSNENERLVAQNISARMPEEDWKKVQDVIQKLTPEKPVGEVEHRVFRADGATRWLHWMNRGFFNKVGELQEIQAVGRDITARIEAERNLRWAMKEKESYRLNLETIFSSIPDAIVTVDSNLNIIESNKAFETLLAKSRSQIVNQHIETALPFLKEHEIALLQAPPPAESGGQEYTFEHSFNGKDTRILTLNAAPLINPEQEQIGAVLIIRDITRLATLEKELTLRHSFQNIVGKHESMQKIFNILERLADHETTVLITGESGTGKELIAEALHFGSIRKERPLVKVNCSALSESLLESELFGHVRGAFTGAIRDNVGRIEAAQNGTLFLDEIGDISPHIQLKLLRFLEQKEFERVGDPKTVKADVRVIAATNQNLQEEVLKGRFRQDLFYRLKVVNLHLPPLRERSEDIPLLIEHFLNHFRSSMGNNIQGISQGALAALMRHSWPGNIRELRHAIEHACILSSGDVIDKECLPLEILEPRTQTLGAPPAPPQTPTPPSPYEQRAAIQETPQAASLESPNLTWGKLDRDAILMALNQSRWNKSKAAKALGINRKTLYRKMSQLKIQ